MQTRDQPNLATLLRSASCLLDSENAAHANNASPTLKSLLEDRLHKYYNQEGINASHHFPTLEAVQLATAKECLSVLETAERILENAALSETDPTPVIGTRDLRKVRTLIALVFKWGLEPLVVVVGGLWTVDMDNKSDRVVEVDSVAAKYQTLSQLITRVMSLIFPRGVHESMAQTFISTTITTKHVVDILRPSLMLGWLPKSLSTESTPTIDHLRPFTMRLLSTLSPAVAITALGTILSTGNALPTHVRRTCSSFLTQQLLRPRGVIGLCESVFGQEEASGEDVKFEKLEQVSRTLISVPSKMLPQDYYHIIVPRTIDLLSESNPPSYRKIAAFTLSKMLGSDKSFPYQDLTSSLVCSAFHAPFLHLAHKDPRKCSKDNPERLKPSVAFSSLVILISNCDPSPGLISTLLSPIVPALYSLLFHLNIQKTSDPRLKETVQGVLITWGKIVDASKAVDIIWSILEHGDTTHWKFNIDGDFDLTEESRTTSPLSLLTPADIEQGQKEPDITTNLFDFYPDPVHFVGFLQTLDRGDVVSELFVKILETYRQLKSSENDPMQSLHYLQIFMQMQIQLLGDTSSSILNKPDQLLSFIKQVLETTTPSHSKADALPKKESLSRRRLDMKDVDGDSDNVYEGDSDDDDPNSEVIKPDDEMIDTGINLLLSVLESHENLSARTAPILNDIFSLLEPISSSGSSTLRPLAREARMVITARSASSSSARSPKEKGNDEESAQEVYQKALKLLQDPILPVRAHGLLLLRELVTPNPTTSKDSATLTDPALIPAILSIFLQSIQDDDSYIFLNGVQGLAAMVDNFGHVVLRGLVRDYSDGLDAISASSMSQEDLDVRVRIGEALGTVIRRCGTSLGKYGDMLIPALFRVFRTRDIPVTLRTSALSLLADAINTYPLAMLPYTEDLAQGMIDLLQIENRSSSETKGQPESKDGDDQSKDSAQNPEGDKDHLSNDPKYPPLRRAALHLLALLLRATARVIDEGQSLFPFSGGFIKRAHVTLEYISITDYDTVVRIMARETKEELASFESSILG